MGNRGVSPALLRDWREIPSLRSWSERKYGDLIQQAVESLPDIYREVFLLRDVQELNVNETAEALGINIPNVKGPIASCPHDVAKTAGPSVENNKQNSETEVAPMVIDCKHRLGNYISLWLSG